MSTAVRFRRSSLSTLSDPRLSRALRHISISTWWIAGYVACVGPATITGALGWRGLEELHSLGHASGTVGAFIVNWGFSGAAIDAWRADRKDFAALAPLWRLTRSADPAVGLTDPDPLAERLGFLHVREWHLLNRMTDILTAARSLYPYMSPAPAEYIRTAAAERAWTPEDQQAAAAAATLLAAVDQKRRGAAPLGEDRRCCRASI
ncbi:DUF6545 domain-containing protein [Streptomyces sp. NPDC059003]|uniref:DUF6545 domain-containing protein n=1 Tax=Streptomyces sp. NPDC059003 TaxID=3346691 RepID=UPI0036A509BA